MANFPCSNCKKECLSELAGTYLLVVIGPASVILAPLIPNLTADEVLGFIALTFGGIVGLLILLFGEHSGAVFNPAITLGATIAKTLQSKYFVPYLIFQITGGLVAGLTLRGLFYSISSPTDLGSTKLAIGVTPFLGIVLETGGTFVLTASALLASSRLSKKKFQGLLVGLTLFLLILLIGPITGAGFNPARSIGPSVASDHFQNLWVYIVGPTLGGTLAGLVFRGFSNARSKSKLNIVCVC